MSTLDPQHPLAVAVADAIHRGDLAALRRLLSEHPDLVVTRLGDDDPDGMSRTLLHVATDWPGHFPRGREVVSLLAEAGSDVNARFRGPHEETPLHWAASSDDVDVLDALLDAGADIEAPGSVIAGGPPLENARAFAQWNAARRLVQRGARTTLVDAAALDLLDRVEDFFAGEVPPAEDVVNHAFWGACHGGASRCAEHLAEHGADVNWLAPWEPLTPLDAASRSGAQELASWLRARGARTASELDG